MAIHLLVNGNKIEWMDLEIFFAQMDIIKENLSKIKEKEMDHSFTIMGKFLKANGIKMKDTEKANLLIKMELSLKKDSGSIINFKIEFYILNYSLHDKTSKTKKYLKLCFVYAYFIKICKILIIDRFI